MSGLVNGGLREPVLSRFATALTLNGELQQRDFFGPLRRTKPILLASWNGFGGVWHS